MGLNSGRYRNVWQPSVSHCKLQEVRLLELPENNIDY